MIEKNNSKDLMNRFKDAETDINDIKNNLTNLIALHNKKSIIIDYIQNYNSSILQKLINQTSDASNISDKLILSLEDNVVSGTYGIYGKTVHPAFASTPDNLFNFRTSEGYVYKNNGKVTINGNTRDEYQSILKHDTIDGIIPVFDVYDSDTLTLKIEFDDSGTVIDNTFNVIELATFLQGSFNITSLVIETNNNLSSSSIEYDNINDVANMRICLSDKIIMKSITFTIKLLYQDESGKYPFGMKHIYLYNADYKDSYIVYNFNTNQYIDSISDKIILNTQFGDISTTCTEQNIDAFLYCLNDVLYNAITFGSNSSYSELDRNTKNIYIKIPLATSLISLKFDTINFK